ncbi:hypothetical protein QBC47DRAFT_186906 [Echria macrotheca]|uniref:DUF8004 domain-containing protein n=1 Tax=Echria macrotheca TaxID=438768 RepID=A0AAJ0BDY9_9PEZI|nr:hypothetical protein QBC47DRAFT_186906 [Echria macrotheca]
MADSHRAGDLSWAIPAVPEPSAALRDATERNGPSKTRISKPRRHSGALELRVPEMNNIRRWDGAARACYPWDHLGRDPELWFKNGNCFVHLYGKGQSRRGPAFKVPLEALLKAKCHPLIARFMVRDPSVSPSSSLGREYFDSLDRISPGSRVELYIPPPAMSTREEALRYHIATRNFFAWVFRRSLVGEHLGSTLIALLNSMSDFRRSGEDNMDGLLGYLDEEGYLEMRNQPIHALAVLHFAEHFHVRDLYIDAFTHCVGMLDQLFAIAEYQVITSTTRKLIRQAKSEMETRLGQAGVMLRNFLEEDLSETHIGLTAGGRAHLDRFRTFLLTFFTSKLGYYPPGSTDSRSLIFEREVYCSMRQDFEALYEYLVDESFTTSGLMPALAQGGICTLQSVHGFDLRNKYPSLQHPLPLLPEISPTTSCRRMSWLTKTDKLRPDQRVVTHAALLSATNKAEREASKNALVAAYRKFEEESIFSPHKADRHEKLSQVDARKIRWILIYSTYQVLRDCAGAPPECHEAADVKYNIAISTANLPPWQDGNHLSVVQDKVDTTRRGRRLTISAPITPAPASPTFSPEIKPDIDYFALTHQNEPTSRSSSPPAIPPRCQSLNKKSFRRSLNIFASSQCQSVVLEQSGASGLRSRASSYHQILVQGYGNGTNEVQLDTPEGVESEPTTALFLDTLEASPIQEEEEPETSSLHPKPLSLAIRSPSTSSNSSANSTSKSSTSALSETATSVSSAPSPGPSGGGGPLPTNNQPSQSPSSTTSWTAKDALLSRKYSFKQRSGSATTTTNEQAAAVVPAVPRRSSRRKLLSALHPIPLRIRKGTTTTTTTTTETIPSPSADLADDPTGWQELEFIIGGTVSEEEEGDENDENDGNDGQDDGGGKRRRRRTWRRMCGTSSRAWAG